MRKRKSLIGVTLALATAVAVPAVAHGQVTSQGLKVAATTTKQDRKIRGPVGAFDVTVSTTYAFGAAATGQSAQQTVLDFDKDFAFTTTVKGSASASALAQCSPTALIGTSTAAAQAACPGSQVGSGDAQLCNTTVGCVGAGNVTAVVTAFNGTPVSGNPQILLHTRTSAGTTTVLSGVLGPSPLGGEYGRRLDVSPIPDTTLTGGLVITNFHTNIPQLAIGKGTLASSAKKKKKKKLSTIYYVMGSCSNKTWDFTEKTTFRAGGTTPGASTTQACTQRKAKKKKKKK